MRVIKLGKDKETLVDDWDYLRFGQMNWYFDGRYAAIGISIGGEQKKFYLHRLILNPPEGSETDHINRDKLDNQRSNLRVVSRAENVINNDIRSDNKSGYKGVCWDSEREKWIAFVKRNGKNIFFKRFDTKEEALEARFWFLAGI